MCVPLAGVAAAAVVIMAREAEKKWILHERETLLLVVYLLRLCVWRVKKSSLARKLKIDDVARMAQARQTIRKRSSRV